MRNLCMYNTSSSPDYPTMSTPPTGNTTRASNDHGPDNVFHSYPRHSDLWFSDGSVVLLAERMLFRVHISQLSRHSAFFRDMFLLPQPSPSTFSSSVISEDLLDGLPVVQLHDTAEDVSSLLVALYDGPSFGNNNRDDFRVVSGILRLSTKYVIDLLRAKALAHLSTAWPASLKAWDAREEISRMYESETTMPRGLRYPPPIEVVNLAREINAPNLLPSAFYDLSRYHFSQIFDSGQEDAIHGSSSAATLAPSDLQCLALGKEASLNMIITLIQSMGAHYQREHIAHPVGSVGSRHRRSYGLICHSGAACRQDFAELVELATQHYLVDREKGCTDPLYVAEELGQLKSAEVSECKACARSLETWASKEREKIWKLIPQWFRLD